MELKTICQALWTVGICFVVANASTVEAEEERIVRVRDVDVEIGYQPVGCFNDKKDRALRKLVKNFRISLGSKMWEHWPNMSQVIQGCAEEVFQKGQPGMNMFGIQFYGECFSDEDAANRYDKYGPSVEGCINGVGKELVNHIYSITVKPLVVKAPESVCHVQGQTFIDNDKMELLKANADMSEAECHQCTCLAGQLVDCHHIFHCVLNDSDCKRYVRIPDQCCPQCIRDEPDNMPKCRLGDQEYGHGESMELLKHYPGKERAECHQCTCASGNWTQCHRIYYCEPNCKKYIKVEGQCCPDCVRDVIPKPTPPFCEVNGRKYKHGESMEVLNMAKDQKTAKCHQCRCNKGKLERCHHIFHCSMNASNCERYQQVEGQCCPQCVPFESEGQRPSCKINGHLFKHGESAEVLHESEHNSNIYCQQCKCYRGKHLCHKIYDCHVKEMACEKTVKIPGQCCPLCGCYNNGRRVAPGEQWEKVVADACIKCTCQNNGGAKCTRSQANEGCPECANPIPVKGQCCPKCG